MKTAIFKALLFFLLLSGIESAFSQPQRYIDSVENLIKQEKSDTMRIKHLQTALYGSIDKFSLDVVEGFLTRMKKELDRHPWKKGDVLYHHAKGIILFYRSEYDEALKENFTSLNLARSLGEKRAMARSYGNIALVYQIRADYITSLKYHFKGLDLEKKLKNPGGVADSYNNIGIIYENLGQYAKALWYQQKSMAARIRMKDYAGVQKNLSNIGNIYLSQDKFDSAFNNYQRSLKHAVLLQDKNAIAVATSCLANVYYERYEYDSGLVASRRANKIFAEVGNERGWLATAGNLAENFLELKQMDSAKYYCELALAAAKRIHAPEAELTNSRILLKINQRSGNYKDAFFLSQRVMFLKDSVMGAEKKADLARFEVRHEYALKEERRKAKRLLEKRKENIIFYSVVAGFVISLLFGSVVWRSLRNNKRKNKIIEEQKIMVEAKQKEVMDSIHYAKRIQEALLPSDRYFDKNLKRLYKGKE
jgi:tetratricopeptide (TPR) repeat protein